jgi:hypothetical protein
MESVETSSIAPGTASDSLQAQSLIQQTEHSIVELINWKGAKAVIKRRLNRDDSRTIASWHREVEALRVLGTQVRLHYITLRQAIGIQPTYLITMV